MFIRKNRNRSGSISVQIITKIGRRNKVIKTVGCARTYREEELLVLHARTEIERIEGLQSLFIEHDDAVVDNFVSSITNDNLRIAGTELILGKIYDLIGYPNEERHNFFRNLVLCRLVYPGSKLKTVEYFKRHLTQEVSVYSVYRFMDKLHSKLKQQFEEITFAHTQKILRGEIRVVFYDMTTFILKHPKKMIFE